MEEVRKRRQLKSEEKLQICKEATVEAGQVKVKEELAEPSRELATRILMEVGFDDRFIGYILRERVGAKPVTCYSFREVVNLLRDRLPQVDFGFLARWVSDVMEDEELAERIAMAVEKGTNDYERVLLVRDLAERRLRQCKDVVA